MGDDGDGPKDVDIGPRDDLIAAAEELKRGLPQLLEYIPVVAELKKAQFDALVKEGFTPAQALQLIKPGMEI